MRSGTYKSADSCTSSAAEKKASFCHISKLFATIIFTNRRWKKKKGPLRGKGKQKGPNRKLDTVEKEGGLVELLLPVSCPSLFFFAGGKRRRKREKANQNRRGREAMEMQTSKWFSLSRALCFYGFSLFPFFFFGRKLIYPIDGSEMVGRHVSICHKQIKTIHITPRKLISKVIRTLEIKIMILKTDFILKKRSWVKIMDG